MLIIYREELIDEIVEEIRKPHPQPEHRRDWVVAPLCGAGATLSGSSKDPSRSEERGVGKLKVYVFSPGRYAFNDNFREVEDKVELVALPAAIYDAYKKVLPKRKEKLFESGITNPLQQEDTKFPTDLFEGQGV